MPQYLHKKSPTSCWYQDNVYFRTSSTIWLLRKCTVHSYKKKTKTQNQNQQKPNITFYYRKYSKSTKNEKKFILLLSTDTY